MTAIPPAYFSCDPDPENPGWHRWLLSDTTRYNESVLGRVIVREEGQDSARVRMTPAHHHTNSAGTIHGAVILGFTDIALFAAMYLVRGVNATGSSTVDLSTQFIAGGDSTKPLDAVIEVLRETRRLAFLRGLIMQDDVIVASFSSTIRKPSEPRP